MTITINYDANPSIGYGTLAQRTIRLAWVIVLRGGFLNALMITEETAQGIQEGKC